MTRVFLSAILISACTAHLFAEPVDFVRDIRPILSENCVFCHGPDENQRQADLRLDTHDGALSVIETDDADASELLSRLITDDDDLKMPPPDSNRALTKQQIDLVRTWIDQGAKWEQHWSFKPIVRPKVPDPKPDVKFPIRNPIDAFIQSRLRLESVSPSPEADRRTLIRRLSLDLTGLPPASEAVNEFLADEKPGAYERLVDRVLNSHAYGQRMAWEWLDAARYADTNGYQGDRERTMWPWRDWVVKSFNDNLPYDQFTRWQVAGDQLPDATDEQKMATGFFRNHMINGEGGRIAEENRVEYVMDMTETLGTVWLGLTLNCCRCHDHKYDPITNQEYYQLFAFFNQTPVKGNGGDPQTAPNLAMPTQAQIDEKERIEKQIADQDKRMSVLAKELTSKQTAWEHERTKEFADATKWRRLRPHTTFSNRQRMRVLDDLSILTSGPNPDNDTYTLTAKTKLSSISALRIEALRHNTMTKGGIARSNSGNFVLTEVEVTIVDPNDEVSRKPIKIVSGEATFEQGGLKIENTFDGKKSSGWAVLKGGKIDQDHAAVLRFEKAVPVPEGMEIEIVLRHDSQHKQHNLGRFRLSLTDVTDPKLSDEQDSLVQALTTPADERTDEDRKVIGKAHRESNPEYQKLKKQRDGFVKQRSSLQGKVAKVMVLEDMPKPRETFVLTRGLYNKPAEQVDRAFPEFLPRPEREQANDPPNRLSLADWLIDPKNPLTARVTVNRFWQQVFGIGLVKTSEDFGRQGESPIHMDLVNWLAADFRDNDWNVKELIRLMVTSHAYRQSSKTTAEAYERDPDNRLLARGARYRMPSWMLRDQALAASGLMSDVSGGPSVNTYQPPGVWEEATFGKKKYQQDSGEKLYRRSLYTFWRRIIAPTMFFDNASRQTCTVKVLRTNTPLHALQTLNNTIYVESARTLAERTLQKELADDKQRIDYVFNRVLARPASPKEHSIFARGLDRTRSQFLDKSEAAEKLLAVGESERDDELDTIEHAVWTTLCLSVLNLDETLNRE